MVLFPNEWITGPNEVKDRVVVVQPDRRRRTGGGVAPGELCGPCLTDDGLPPDSVIIERPAPEVERGDGGAAALPCDPPPGRSPRTDPTDENR